MRTIYASTINLHERLGKLAPAMKKYYCMTQFVEFLNHTLFHLLENFNIRNYLKIL
jgi:hypothetical protein